MSSEVEYAKLLRRLRPTEHQPLAEYSDLVDRLRRPSLMRRIVALLF